MRPLTLPFGQLFEILEEFLAAIDTLQLRRKE